MCEKYYKYCVECLWVEPNKIIRKFTCRNHCVRFKMYLIKDMCCKCQSFVEAEKQLENVK